MGRNYGQIICMFALLSLPAVNASAIKGSPKSGGPNESTQIPDSAYAGLKGDALDELIGDFSVIENRLAYAVMTLGNTPKAREFALAEIRKMKNFRPNPQIVKEAHIEGDEIVYQLTLGASGRFSFAKEYERQKKKTADIEAKIKASGFIAPSQALLKREHAVEGKIGAICTSIPSRSDPAGSSARAALELKKLDTIVDAGGSENGSVWFKTESGSTGVCQSPFDR